MLTVAEPPPAPAPVPDEEALRAELIQALRAVDAERDRVAALGERVEALRAWLVGMLRQVETRRREAPGRGEPGS